VARHARMTHGFEPGQNLAVSSLLLNDCLDTAKSRGSHGGVRLPLLRAVSRQEYVRSPGDTKNPAKDRSSLKVPQNCGSSRYFTFKV
jgi:hypothetical protein